MYWSHFIETTGYLHSPNRSYKCWRSVILSVHPFLPERLYFFSPEDFSSFLLSLCTTHVFFAALSGTVLYKTYLVHTGLFEKEVHIVHPHHVAVQLKWVIMRKQAFSFQCTQFSSSKAMFSIAIYTCSHPHLGYCLSQNQVAMHPRKQRRQPNKAKENQVMVCTTPK